MSNNDLTAEMLDKLTELGVPKEIIQKLTDGSLPTAHSHAEGGKGQAVNITYVDNYSTLLLVYTFLLNSLDRSEKSEETNSLNKSLLLTLKAAMKEQQEFRKAFLTAVNSLRK
ncbi:hypothetical protein [Mesobacillus foraminis]|uniref:Uncharacterized protein n=1 Tax=Mesobacillus foraminis TaxID=279826 RepID=A0A4R2BKR6_9BACI|nr:hypothetical protein [Mesobacillus foraminis]TCN27827.1 hypothetical protein EV146_101155 [Mesobacillus foraminis]